MLTEQQIDQIAAIIDPPAWSGRERRTDEYRRSSARKRALAIANHLGIGPAQAAPAQKVAYYRSGECRNSAGAMTHTYAQMEDGGLFPMCGYGWNRSDGTRFSIFRGAPGTEGDCKVCRKNVAAGAAPLFDGFPHKTRWL